MHAAAKRQSRRSFSIFILNLQIFNHVRGTVSPLNMKINEESNALHLFSHV